MDDVQNSVENALSDIIGSSQGTAAPNTPQLNLVDTLFNNTRGYLISNYRQLLSSLYVESGLIQTIVDIPVDDAFRSGYDIKTKLLDADEIEELHAEIENLDANMELAQAFKWNRLYGGAGLIIVTGQDPMTPLDIDAISEDEPLSFRPVDLWELYSNQSKIEDEARSAEPMKPLTEHDYYDFYGVKIHKSRVLTIRGKTPPSFIRPRLRGWGFSVIESLIRSVNQYLKSNNIAFEVLDEFKLDIFRISGFNQSIATKGGTGKLIERVAQANFQKNYQNALTMDISDAYEQKQLSFAGLGDIMREIRMQIASDMRMPMSKLFGISAQGLQSNQDDIEVYNGMVESEVRSKGRKPTNTMVRLIAKKKFGVLLDDMTIHFRPMRVLTAEQEENVKTSKFARVTTAIDKGLCSPREAGEAINRDSLLPVQVDVANLEEEISRAQPDTGVEGGPVDDGSGEDSSS